MLQNLPNPLKSICTNFKLDRLKTQQEIWFESCSFLSQPLKGIGIFNGEDLFFGFEKIILGRHISWRRQFYLLDIFLGGDTFLRDDIFLRRGDGDSGENNFNRQKDIRPKFKTMYFLPKILKILVESTTEYSIMKVCSMFES